MITPKRFKVKLNSPEKIEELLQELYNEACKNIEEIQIQMNKVANSVQLNDEIMDAKAKYAKAMNDFIVSKDKAIGRKLEIAKLLSEILKYNGNLTKASENSDIFNNFKWDDLQKMAQEEDDDNKPKEYKIK
jgi:hypothetical protein